MFWSKITKILYYNIKCNEVRQTVMRLLVQINQFNSMKLEFQKYPVIYSRYETAKITKLSRICFTLWCTL